VEKILRPKPDLPNLDSGDPPRSRTSPVAEVVAKAAVALRRRGSKMSKTCLGWIHLAGGTLLLSLINVDQSPKQVVSLRVVCCLAQVNSNADS